MDLWGVVRLMCILLFISIGLWFFRKLFLGVILKLMSLCESIFFFIVILGVILIGLFIDFIIVGWWWWYNKEDILLKLMVLKSCL